MNSEVEPIDVVIDERLRSYMRRLRPEEFSQLEENILQNGCRDPLVLWNGVLIDGHNRYEICSKHGLPFFYENVEFEDFDEAVAWIEENQLGRRNLTADEFAYHIGRKYERAKKAHGGDRKSEDAKSSGNFCHLMAADRDLSGGKNCHAKTAGRIASEHGLSARNVRNAAEFAKNVDTIADTLGHEARVDILSGVGSPTRADVAEVAEKVTEGLRFASPKEAFDWVKQQRIEASRVRREELARVAEVKPPLPPGQYSTIVIDPPWPMEKIERDVRQKQVAFEYPTMTEDQLKDFGSVVNGMAHDECHLFMWTTQKYLPLALELLDVWGFRYVLTMVWHKSGGFQPVGLPQYNCEFVLYARRGSPKFADTKAFNCCFEAPRREHSRKPDEFYDLVRRVTDGSRIDVFSRERRGGFDQYGNEADKFEEAV
jgi:N6-adenosine-specific RNA methylase IME4